MQEATQQSKGKLEQSRLLYDIAVKKCGMYEALTKALLETQQTGAYKILLNGARKHRPDSIIGANDVNPHQLESALEGFGGNVLDCLVIFQGQEVVLHEALQILKENVAKQLIDNYLDEKLKEELIGNKRPVLVNNSTIPDSLPYYIYRRMTTRSYLDPAIFNHRCNDVFVVNRIQLNDLSTLAKNQDTDLSSNQLESLTVRFIVLEYEEEYEEICSLSTDHPVHLIDHNSGRFLWIRTSGDISTIQKFVSEKQDELTEENFLHSCLLSSQPVCISDTPGMGKTVLLTNLANRILQIHPRHLLRFIVLREFIPVVQEKGKDKINKDMLIDIISNQASDFEFGREVVRELLRSEEKVVILMFDGFDEVLFNQVETAKVALKILSELKAVRLYVATRPHMRDELEQSLGTLGYNILPFGESEQAECLTKYWEQHKAFKGHNLEEFAKLCLKKLEESMKDSERGIAGIPLQCKMLAEVYQKDAIKYSKLEKRISEIDTGVVIKITSIFDMYQKLVDLRFERIHPLTNEKVRKKAMMFAHMTAAVQLLFPEFNNKLQNILFPDSEKIEVHQLCSLGILEKKKTNISTPRFIHRTFAEYFLGLFTVRMLLYHKDFGVQPFRKEFLDFFVNTVLLTAGNKEPLLNSCKLGKFDPISSASFQYQVICYFVNAHLKFCQKNEVGKSPCIASVDAKKLYDVLAACIVHDYPVLFQRTSEEPNTFPQVFLNTSNLAHLSLLSAKYASFELFRAVHTNTMQYAKDPLFVVGLYSNEFYVSPLHVAAERGLFSIVNFYINSYSPDKLGQLKYVIHCCVAGSIRDNSAMIKNKIEIIKLIKRIFPEWINEQMANGITPLLQSGVHVKLLQELLEAGADVNATNKDGCVMHTILANEVVPEKFSDLAIDLVLNHKFNRFDTIDTKNKTPLHAILEKLDLDDGVVQLFHLMGADFNAVDKFGNSVLFYAVRGRRSDNVFNCLLSLRARTELLNFNQDNIFHICAKCGNHDAFQYFLEGQNIDKNLINTVNKNGTTPFMLAFKSGKGLPIHTINLLEKNGFKITEQVASDALKALICNKYIMAWELGDDFAVIADYLMQKGGVVKCADAKTPWELETTKRNMSKIIHSTVFSDALMLEVAKRGIPIEKIEANLQTTTMYNESLYSIFRERRMGVTEAATHVDQLEPFYLKLKDMQSSFERLCISLVSCNQIKPFMLLKQCLQSDLQEALKFISPLAGLVEFLHSEEELMVVLRSWDAELSIARIKNTIDSDANVITKEDLKTNQQNEDLTVYQCTSVTVETLQQVASLKCKTVCLVNVNNEICQPITTLTLTDDFSWNDLASEFQNQLLLTYRVRNDVKGIPYQRNYLELQNNGLVYFIQEQGNSKSEIEQNLREYKQDFLVKSQFFQLYISPDLIATTMHVAIKRGHSSIAEYLLKSTSFTEVLSIKYLVHCCVAETINESENTISEKITILKLLSTVSKHWLDETLPGNISPLMQPNVHRKLMEILIECGADIKPAVLCGKEISLIVINILEEKGIMISIQAASKMLQGLFCDNNINRWNFQTDFMRVCDFLIRKGGVLRCRNDKNPWELETTQKNLPKISEVTSCSSDMLAELQRRGLQKIENVVNSDELYRRLQASVLPNSFEILCLVLISCQQIEPFVLLKLCLQCDMSYPTLFVTPPKNVAEFTYLQQKPRFFLRSWDFELSISRLQETINPDILVISQGKTILEETNSPLTVCVFDRISQKEVDHLATFKHKIICLFKFADDGLNECAMIPEDEICWGDLSADLQHDLLDFQVSEISSEISQLENEELVEFIHENFPVFTGFENEEGTNEKDNYLSTDIFNHFLPDKLVFCGVTREELYQFVKFGHNIGVFGDDLSKLDFVLLDCKEQFDEMCKQTSYTLHLIEHYRASFKLVQTHGSATNVERFLQDKTAQCEDFPFCTCGKHKVGSGNLIWNGFRLPGKKQSYWVNILDMFTDMKSKATFKLGKSTNLKDVTKLFNITFNINKLELWRQIRNSIGGSFLQVHSTRFTDLIKKLLKFIDCDVKERQLLRDIAVQTLFPSLLKGNVTLKLEKYAEFEILEYTNESVVFVHKPLAWYFIAELAASKESRPMVAQIQQEILQDCFESHEVKIEFATFGLDGIGFLKLIKTFKFIHSSFFESLENLWTSDFLPNWISDGRTNEFRMKWFHACVFGNCFHLFNLMDGAQKKIFKSEDLVTFAVLTADLPIINAVSEKFQQNSKKEIFDIVIKYVDHLKREFQISILHVAALRGNYHVVQYLLVNKQFKLKLGQPIMRNILAYCVYKTQNKPEQVSERKRMIKLLLDSDKTLIHKGDDQSWNSPLLVKKVHVHLISYLIRLGMNVHCVNKWSQNVLHVCPEYMTPQEYHKLIQVLHNREDSKIFHARDYMKTTPLHMAVRGLEVLESTLQLFSVASVDFNATDKDSNTVLIWAVNYRRSLRLLEALIQCGADIHHRGRFNETILHVAVEYGNCSALRYLILQGCDVNARDVDDDTVLHLLFIYIKDDIHDTVKMLIEKGADVNAVNQEQQTPLTVALIRMQKVENRTLELLRNAGAHE